MDESKRLGGSIARSFGRNRRVGQLSTMAGAIALFSISASDWVANTTLAFFLRRVLSHHAGADRMPED